MLKLCLWFLTVSRGKLDLLAALDHWWRQWLTIFFFTPTILKNLNFPHQDDKSKRKGGWCLLKREERDTETERASIYLSRVLLYCMRRIFHRIYWVNLLEFVILVCCLRMVYHNYGNSCWVKTILVCRDCLPDQRPASRSRTFLFTDELTIVQATWDVSVTF